MQRRGHRATILTSSQHRVRIEQHGIQFRQAAPNQDFSDREFQRRAMNEMTGGQYLLRDNFLPKIRESYENLLAAATDADLLVTQMLVYAGPLVAEKTSLPWVSTVLAPLSFFSYEDSPVLASRLNVVRESVPRLNALINRVARSTTQSWNEPVYRLRRELGLGRGAEPIYEGQHSPACVLALFSSVLAPAQSDWPRQTTITGFPFLEETASHAEVPPALDEFLAAGPAPVVFTLGTSAVLNPRAVLRREREGGAKSGRAGRHAGRRERAWNPGRARHPAPCLRAARLSFFEGRGSCAGRWHRDLRESDAREPSYACGAVRIRSA